MTDLTKLSFELFALRRGSSDLKENGMNPVSERFENKSWRNEVTSRTVEADMKF